MSRPKSPGVPMTISRVSFFAAILVVAFAGFAHATPTTVSAEVNLRDSPSTTGRVLALIPKGTVVEASTCTNGWCLVSWNGQQGYAISRNLGIAQPRSAQPGMGVRRPMPPQVYASGPAVYDPDPVYVGPPYPYYRGYYGYYGPYAPFYFGPRIGFGWGWRRW